MKFLHPEDERRELTYQDLFLMPKYSDVGSRMKVDLTPVDGVGTTLPIIVANMMAVAGRRMAETVTRRGGLVVLPQDYSLERIEQIVKYVKQCHHVFETPVVLEESESVQTALNLIYKRAHGAIIVVDHQHRPVGIFTEADAAMRDKFVTIGSVMTRDVVTVESYRTPQEIFQVLHNQRLPIVPVVYSDGSLAGVMTRKGTLRATMYKPAVNDKNEMLTAAAVGIREGVEETVKRLMEIGVDVIVLDTAHGHQKKMLEAIRSIRAIVGPDRPLAAGNIVSEQAAKDFIDAGANILKVGVGPGAVCTTRMMTGMGRPQFSAVYRTSQIARQHGAHVWADGGIRHPRDVALAIAAGASAAYFGSWWAGTYESPADIQHDGDGGLFKENFGMASRRAVKNRNENQISVFDLAKKQYFEEGISHSKMYLKNREESAEDIIDHITAGLRSACTYAGANNLEEFYQNAVVGVQSASGFYEGKALEGGW
ncbi:MAG: GuaB1 family IMP dehydrogenase-related protein [Patescibacteria group bacterium]